MNILMIGNGFDIAHGLATSYPEFMEFVKNIKNSQETGVIETFKEVCDTNDAYARELASNSKILEDMRKAKINISENLWFIHFINREEELKGKDKWIDFEAEIAKVIKALDDFYEEEKTGEGKWKDILVHMFDEVETSDGNTMISIESCEKIRSRIYDDLEELICLFEIYINEVVTLQELKELSEDIIGLSIDAFLSFNYTSTYLDYYQSQFIGDIKDVHFVHGIARNRKEYDLFNNNMIIGIDDYLEEPHCNSNTRFIKFKKYFQRIHKRTEGKYKNWIKSTIESGKSNLYIFGHSLGYADRDVIKELIMCEGMYTTIFNHNDDAYAEQIENLVKIIGRDNLIEKVADETILFVKQGQMRKILPDTGIGIRPCKEAVDWS